MRCLRQGRKLLSLSPRSTLRHGWSVVAAQKIPPEEVKKALPPYLVAAIEYVTVAKPPESPEEEQKENAAGE